MPVNVRLYDWQKTHTALLYEYCTSPRRSIVITSPVEVTQIQDVLSMLQQSQLGKKKILSSSAEMKGGTPKSSDQMISGAFADA